MTSNKFYSEDEKEFMKDFAKQPNERYNGYLLPVSFQKFENRIKNMNIRDDDFWVCTYPRTGTTWTQEMLWCIVNGVNNKDIQKSISERFPFLDFSFLFDCGSWQKDDPKLIETPLLDCITYLEKMASPRFIKTHLPFDLLPEKLRNFSTKAKIIHVMRNPRDSCVSRYYHRILLGFEETFEQFAESFLQGNVHYGPYSDHVKGYLKHINHPNVLFLRYEDMKKDLKSSIYKTANFIGISISEEDVEMLQDHLSFSKMKLNPAVNYELVHKNTNFIRRGIVGDWKEKMDSDLCKKFENWEKENLKGVNFSFHS